MRYKLTVTLHTVDENGEGIAVPADELAGQVERLLSDEWIDDGEDNDVQIVEAEVEARSH
jgi:hypothetical protein